MNIVDIMRNDDDIRERDCGEGVSSFNFTSKCFKKGNWNDRTMTARGLFCDTKNDEVVARSFNKFFALGERPETQPSELKKNLVFPLVAYQKENGYLGIVSTHNGKLFVSSKGTNQGMYAENFDRILRNKLSEQQRKSLYHYLNDNNLSMVFEVIDPINDPHIVEYQHEDIVLLDIIFNDYDFKHVGYSEIETIGKLYNLHYKKCVATISNWEEFELFLYTYNYYKHMEGFVIEDSNGFMFKVKLPWYKFWKSLRGMIPAICKGKSVNDIHNFKERCDNDNILMDVMSNWVFDYYTDEGKMPSIIEVRNEYESRSPIF